MTARIYRPAKTAMQSGRARAGTWILEFEPGSARRVEPLMGWTSTDDTATEVRLGFKSRDAAVAYATCNGIDYRLFEPHDRRPRIKAYADSFK